MTQTAERVSGSATRPHFLRADSLRLGDRGPTTAWREPEGIDLDGVSVAPCGSYVCIVDRHTQDLLLVLWRCALTFSVVVEIYGRFHSCEKSIFADISGTSCRTTRFMGRGSRTAIGRRVPALMHSGRGSYDWSCAPSIHPHFLYGAENL